MIAKYACTALLIPSLIISTGCSAFRSPTQVLTVTTMPPDAVLTINGIKYHPPAQIPIRRDQPAVIQCEAEGFGRSHRCGS